MATIEEIERTKSLVRQGILTAPDGFMDESSAKLTEICNGCGSAGAGLDAVPDTMWGLCICGVCNIHDYGYHIGRTESDKEREDYRFLVNLLKLIKHGSANWFTRNLRRSRALKYFIGVAEFGRDAFWSGK